MKRWKDSDWTLRHSTTQLKHRLRRHAVIMFSLQNSKIKDWNIVLFRMQWHDLLHHSIIVYLFRVCTCVFMSIVCLCDLQATFQQDASIHFSCEVLSCGHKFTPRFVLLLKSTWKYCLGCYVRFCYLLCDIVTGSLFVHRYPRAMYGNKFNTKNL